MANILTSIKNWSTTASSNQPDGTDAATIAGDLQAIQAGVRFLRSQDTIASGTTTDIGSKDAESLTVSGTTTITSLGTVSTGIIKRVVFSGALTLTHNATSLILPTSSNITTAAGDTAIFESLGSGNWRCNIYAKKDGTALSAPASVSSASQSEKDTGSNNTKFITPLTSNSRVAVADGTADVITATFTANPITAWSNNIEFYTISSGANTGPVTVNPDGIGAKTGAVNANTNLAAGAIAGANQLCHWRYNATTDKVVLLNPAVIPVTTVDALSTASGSAPSYSARAWVNFNGTGTVAIRASGNVSSITDNGTGDYTINFTNALVDSNYSATFGSVGSAATDSNRQAVIKGSETTGATLKTTTQLRVNTGSTASGVLVDLSEISCAVFR